MRFHFDPNNINKIKLQQQEKQQKQAKIDNQEQQQVKQTLQMDLVNENQNVGNQIQNQEPQIPIEPQKQIQEELKQMYEPKEGWEKLPDYPFILKDIDIPECNQNELYLTLYQAYMNEEIKRFKEHFASFQELIFYSDKMQQLMNKFIDKEKKMKQQYCKNNQGELPYIIKKLEYQQQINQYEKSIEKFVKAQQKIKLVLQSDVSQHMSVQMINHVQYDQSPNAELFHQKISEFLDKNENVKEKLTERTTQHFAKLSNDSRKIQEENQELEKQIQDLEQKLGKNKNQFQTLNCFI